MLRGFFGNLIFAIIARMLCGNHLNNISVIIVIVIVIIIVIITGDKESKSTEGTRQVDP